MSEFGLTLQSHMPSGIHIHPNWFEVKDYSIDTLTFVITNNTEFTFVDNLLLFDTYPDDNRQRTTNQLDEFLEYHFPSVVHFIEVRDNNVIRLVQYFAFTI